MQSKSSCPKTITLTLVGLTVGFSVGLIAAHMAEAETAPRTHAIQFPEKVSLGPLLLIPSKFVDGEEALQFSTRVGAAQGKRSIEVPSGKLLMLDANRRVFGDSASLQEINPPDIDAIKLGCMGTDDSEFGLCDKSLNRIPRFKNLQYIDIDNSDATDAGLMNVRDLRNLRTISMCESRVRGKCFKEFAKSTSLTQIIMDRCAPDQSNLSYLRLIPNLTRLKLRWSNLDPIGMRGVAGCSKLKFLDISRNRKVDDKSIDALTAGQVLETLNLTETGVTDGCAQSLSHMKNLKNLWIVSTGFTDKGLEQLAQCKKLEYLAVWDTRVTVRGLAALKNLKLKKLEVSTSLYQSKHDKLIALFPHIKFSSVDVGKDLGRMKQMFLPY